MSALPFTLAEVSVKEQNKSLQARRTLEHAFSYLKRDPDALAIVGRAMLEQRDEHTRKFGATRYHRCGTCGQYFSAGCERPQFPTSHVPTSPKDGQIAIKVEIGVPTPPRELLIALDWNDGRMRYSRASHLYYLLWTGDESCCGVFGEGESGSYEWFIWNPSIPAKLETSNMGYGSAVRAFHHVLNVVDKRGDLW